MVASQPLVRVERAVRRFGPITALDGVNLDLPAGAVVALSGPSGSGKSTLLHALAALERLDEGRIVTGGRELGALSRSELAAHRRSVGFVFQRFNLLPALSVLDNVAVPALANKVGFDPRGRAGELLAAVGLAGREAELPSRLSGGEQQRVAIARALINRPSLILADEPTGNLDTRTGAEIVELLLALRDEHEATVVVATHDSGVAARCDRVVRLRDGAVVDDLDVRGTTDVAATAARLARLG